MLLAFKSRVLVTPEAINLACALQMRRCAIPLSYTGLKIVRQLEPVNISLTEPINTSFPIFVAVWSLKHYSEQSLIVACYKGIENNYVKLLSLSM